MKEENDRTEVLTTAQFAQRTEGAKALKRFEASLEAMISVTVGKPKIRTRLIVREPSGVVSGDGVLRVFGGRGGGGDG